MALSRKHIPAAGIALVAIGIAVAFAITTLRHTRPMGLPLDDSYIYLTYAKQFGRGQFFTYFPGGGYSAGSTSVVWPMLLAPFWALGARGHALVWVSFGLCAALYAATCVGVYRLVERIAAGGGVFAAAVLLAIAPFAWTSLSGMEVALASALLVAAIALLLDQDRAGPPTKKLIAVLAAASLSRPEATLLVIVVVGIAVVQRRRAPKIAARWLLPLAAPAAWLAANKLLAGNFFPNTGVAKSHFYLPGFDWTFWIDAVATLTGRMLRGLFWASASPLPVAPLFALLWLAGAVRVARWARRERQRLVGALIVLSPFALILAVIASSGFWELQNFRYIAPAFPLFAIGVGCALAPWVTARRPVQLGAAALAAAIMIVRGAPRLADDARLFAQGAMDTNTQVVAIGRYLHEKLPDASVMFHDAGAIAYYGDGRVYDMLGLVTNHQAGVANNGPGARFEFLESLPPERRPTHFAYYPSWLGVSDFFGADLKHTPLQRGFEARRLVGDGDMQVLEARWDHAGTAERPLEPHPGWALADRVDVADLASEHAHAWTGALGRRRIGDPTARWSLVGREEGARGLLIDGGRTIRGGTERFTLALDPAKPARLILRTGGARSAPYQEAIAGPVELRVIDAARGTELGKATLPAPSGPFVEVAFELPPGASQIEARATGPYRAYHWFALQPE